MQVRTDPLQLLHTLHNLHDLLQHLADKYKAGHIAAAAAAPQDGSSSSSAHAPYGPGVPRTLRDDTLASEAAAIQKNYLTQRMTDLEAAAGPYVKALREALPGHYHRGLGLRTDGQVASKGHPHGPSDAHTKPGLSSSREGSGQRAKATPGSDGSSLWQQAMMGEGVDDDMSWLEDDGAAAASDNDDPGTAAAAAAGHSSGIESGWYTGVLDALESSGKGDEVAELIREKLQEADTYRWVWIDVSSGAWRLRLNGTISGVVVVYSLQTIAHAAGFAAMHLYHMTYVKHISQSMPPEELPVCVGHAANHTGKSHATLELRMHSVCNQCTHHKPVLILYHCWFVCLLTGKKSLRMLLHLPTALIHSTA